MRLMCRRIEIDRARWIIVLIVLGMKGVHGEERESFGEMQGCVQGTSSSGGRKRERQTAGVDVREGNIASDAAVCIYKWHEISESIEYQSSVCEERREARGDRLVKLSME